MEQESGGVASGPLLARIVESLSVPALVLTPDLRVIMCNKPAARLRHREPAEVARRTVHELGEAFTPAAATVRDAVRVGGPVVHEVAPAAGARSTLRVIAAPLARQSGVTLTILVILESGGGSAGVDESDIEQLKARLSAVSGEWRESEERLRHAYEELLLAKRRTRHHQQGSAGPAR